MFPVVELSNLNTDFSFLDDIVSEDNQLNEIKTVADFNSTEGNSFLETNVFYDDWMLGDDLDALTATSNSHQLALDHIVNPGSSDAKHSTSSDSIQDHSSDTFGVSLSVNQPLQTEHVDCEERIYLSSNESTKQLDVQHCKSLVSENEESSLEHTMKDKDSLAGKKYRQMRHKNNIASQRSRKLRKQKNVEMVERLKKLEAENKELTLLATQLEKQRDVLQKQLLQIISKK